MDVHLPDATYTPCFRMPDTYGLIRHVQMDVTISDWRSALFLPPAVQCPDSWVVCCHRMVIEEQVKARWPVIFVDHGSNFHVRDTTAALLTCARQRLIQHHRSCVGALGTAAADCSKEGRVGIQSGMQETLRPVDAVEQSSGPALQKSNHHRKRNLNHQVTEHFKREAEPSWRLS